jgi:hypothetical protein
VLRHDVAEVAQRPQQQVQRHRARVAENCGVRVRGVDRFQILLQLSAVVQLLLPHLYRGVLHVARGERLAVVPGHALAQLEGDGPAIRCRGPGRRQHAHRSAVRPKVDQRLDDLRGHDVDAGGGAQSRVQDALLAAHVHRQHPAAMWLRLCPGRRRGGHRENGGGEQGVAAADRHGRRPWDPQVTQAKAFLRDGKRAAPPRDRGIHATAWANVLGASLDVIDSI